MTPGAAMWGVLPRGREAGVMGMVVLIITGAGWGGDRLNIAVEPVYPDP